MQGVVRREYREYWQGPQRGLRARDKPSRSRLKAPARRAISRRARPGVREGRAPRMKMPACGGVAPLGNASSIPCGERALPQTPWDALKRQNTRDATLGMFRSSHPWLDQKRKNKSAIFFLRTNSIPCVIEFGGTSLCRASPDISPRAAMIGEDFGPVRVLATGGVAVFYGGGSMCAHRAKRPPRARPAPSVCATRPLTTRET